MRNKFEMEFAKPYNYILRIQNGEFELMGELWKSLKPFTNRIARKYIYESKGTRNYDHNDIISACYFALCRTLKNCPLDKLGSEENRLKFASYYIQAIKGETSYLRGTKKRDINNETKSLNCKISPDESDSDERGDLIEDQYASRALREVEHRVYLAELRLAFKKLDRYLTSDERYVIHAEFYQRRSTYQIACELNCSEFRILTLRNKAFAKYRKQYEDVNLRDFL